MKVRLAESVLTSPCKYQEQTEPTLTLLLREILLLAFVPHVSAVI